MSESWRRGQAVAVGGLTDVGFSSDDRYLLVVGHQGRGVLDCATAERVARQQEPHGFYPDEATGAAEGIGPMAGQQVPVAGLMSGRALPVVHGRWHVALTPSGLSISDGQLSQVVPETEEVRAFGFGYQGQTLVLATASDVTFMVLSDRVE